MIPLRLKVKNFMCYRDNVPVLDLEPLHVACLCGENGHGKTALLDAMTWALWGQARARTQDELVHQGQQEMAVELEFLARGQRYRVSRTYSRSVGARRGRTNLELQVSSGNGFRPITGDHPRDTEASVTEILHLDYDTFINTAFLRQGDADRFTTSRPADRKKTLAEVLDLSYYQALEERARERSRSLQGEADVLQGTIELRRQELERRTGHQESLDSAKAVLVRVEPDVEQRRQRVDELRLTVEALRQQDAAQADMQRRLADEHREIEQLRGQATTREAQIGGFEAVVQRRTEIRDQFARLEQARADAARLDAALERKMALETERARLEGDIKAARARLSAQADGLRGRLKNELEPRAGRGPEIEDALQVLAREQAGLVELEKALEMSRAQADGVAAEVRDLKSANERLLGEMEETRKKFNMLDRDESVCPLCRQPLGAEGQDHLRREYESEGRRSRKLYDENADRSTALDRTHRELTARVAHEDSELRETRARAEKERARLERDLEESRKAVAETELARVETRRVDQLIQKEDFAHEERRNLAKLDEEVSGLMFDDAAHRSAREGVRELEGYEELRRSLQEAEERLPSERSELEDVRDMLSRRESEVQELDRRQRTLHGEMEGLPSLEKELADARRHYDEVEKQRQEAQLQQRLAESELERLDGVAGELKGQEARREELTTQVGIYGDLAVAFGKNGIQALIIETAIPQLEADANELLARLTEHRMTLKLQLQEGRKDSRTRLPSEELDIKIADEVGTRSYETFSGGEAFRINFAIRIALSKLLARRSGAPLPILFIDEGFGSLDAGGQERLTQAIQSIQDDFQKIIVITHIDQVKESFPVRIEVTKTGSGSTFEVV
jgi:exonuclease SbcC